MSSTTKRRKLRKRKSTVNDEDYDDQFVDEGGESGELFFDKDVFVKSYGYDLQEKLVDPIFDVHNGLLKKMHGKDFTVRYCQETGFVNPVVFETSEGLDLKLPRKSFSVRNVQNLLGSDRILDVMDVGTQKGLQMTLKKFVNYYSKPISKRKQLWNVLSLEFSNTALEKLVQGPKVIKELDWVELAWPKDLRHSQTDGTNAMISMKYPKVQNYCLMSVGGCFTDFHVDFGGTSVWYHVMRGEKVFWLAPPTEENLQRYKDWTLTGQQQKIFFGDLAEKCFKVRLFPGNTFMIPSGWIHAVYTPVDSLVFGGNFLHSFAIPIQLRVYHLETNTRVPKKFRYPFFHEIQWYLMERYFFALTGISYRKKVPVVQEDQLKVGDEAQQTAKEEDLVGGCTSEASTSGECEFRDDKRDMSEVGDEQKTSVVVDEKSLYSAANLHRMTKMELDGLKCLLKFLSSNENIKRAPDRIRDPELLLMNMKEILNQAVVVEPEKIEGRVIISPPKPPPVPIIEIPVGPFVIPNKRPKVTTHDPSMSTSMGISCSNMSTSPKQETKTVAEACVVLPSMNVFQQDASKTNAGFSMTYVHSNGSTYRPPSVRFPYAHHSLNFNSQITNFTSRIQKEQQTPNPSTSLDGRAAVLSVKTVPDGLNAREHALYIRSKFFKFFTDSPSVGEIFASTADSVANRSIFNRPIAPRPPRAQFLSDVLLLGGRNQVSPTNSTRIVCSESERKSELGGSLVEKSVEASSSRASSSSICALDELIRRI